MSFTFKNFAMKNKFLQLIISALVIAIGISTSAQSWSLTGNSSTNPPTNFLGTKDSKPLLFKTNKVERMRISPTGFVGIGNSPTHAQLEIKGSVGAAVAMFGIGQTGVAIEADNPEIGFNYYYNGGTKTIKAGYASLIGMDPANGDIYIANSGGNKSSSDFGSITGIQRVMTIQQTGWVGIGTSTPGELSGLLEVKSGSRRDAIFGISTESGGGVVGETLGNGPAISGYSNPSNPGWAGFFVGNVYCTGTYQSSDEKLKQKIDDLSSGMDIINSLHPKHYEYRHDGNYKLMNLPDGEHYGLIAQDVEKVLPNLVKDTKFETRYANLNNTDSKNSETINFKALNYTELIPIIIKGLQEQQAINDNQQQQIHEQQRQIDELKKLISVLTSDKTSLINFRQCLSTTKFT